MPIPSAGTSGPERRLAGDRAYDAIRAAILDGTIGPGERLDDADLQRWLGMSKTPIRRALQTLTLEGFVETAAQSYTRVVRPSPEDALLHLQTAGVIVLGMFDLVLGSATAQDRRGLVALVDQIVAGLEAEDKDRSIAAAGAFYLRLSELCPNRVLVRLTQRTLAARAYYVLVAYSALEQDWGEPTAAYRALRTALDSRRIDDARAAVKRIFRIAAAETVPSPLHSSRGPSE